MSDNPLVKFKTNVSAEGAGAELEVHRETAGLIAKLFPGFSAKLRGRRIAAGTVLSKLEQAIPLTDVDLEYASSILGEAELKWARKQAVAERAERLLESDEYCKRLPAPTVQAPSDSPSDTDWAGRLLEDASVVSDDLLSELYARMLASGATQPENRSKRTLGVLRDMDRRIADLFAKALLVECGDNVPQDDALLNAVGLKYSDILELDAVGLLNSSATISNNVSTDDQFFFTNNLRLMMFKEWKGARLPIYPLSRAGRELKRIADVASDDDMFEKLLTWLKGKAKGMPKAKLAHAVMPDRKWSGQISELQWTEVLSGTMVEEKV